MQSPDFCCLLNYRLLRENKRNFPALLAVQLQEAYIHSTILLVALSPVGGAQYEYCVCKLQQTTLLTLTWAFQTENGKGNTALWNPFFLMACAAPWWFWAVLSKAHAQQSAWGGQAACPKSSAKLKVELWPLRAVRNTHAAAKGNKAAN